MDEAGEDGPIRAATGARQGATIVRGVSWRWEEHGTGGWRGRGWWGRAGGRGAGKEVRLGGWAAATWQSKAARVKEWRHVGEK